MGDKLVELIVCGFILLYVANWCGEYELPNEGKSKIRNLKGILFIKLDKRYFHLHNVVLQILNFTLTTIGLAILIIIKERELMVLLLRIAYLFLTYVSVISNLIIAAICIFRKQKKHGK